MKFIKLTPTDDHEAEFIYLKKSKIMKVKKIKLLHKNHIGYDTDGANSGIYFKNGEQERVREKAEDIIRELEGEI